MINPLNRIVMLVALCVVSHLGFALEPIMINYDSGTTTFPRHSSGLANYVVTLHPNVKPNDAPLLFSVSNTGTSHGLLAAQVVPGSSPCSSVSQVCGTAFSLSAGESCCLSFSINSSVSGSYSMQPQVSSYPAVFNGKASSALPVTVTSSLSVLSASVAELALSTSGIARTITIENIGDVAATGLSVSYPAWPSGTTSSTTCGATLLPHAACTISVTPGSTATSSCTAGTVPIPGVVTVSADATSSVETNVVVLGYGCVYQGGYLFAITDSTSTSESIGGKVVTLTDQVSALTTPIPWSSNGSGAASSDVSYDMIPGVGETSTSSMSGGGSPSFIQFATHFTSTYTNSLPFTDLSFNTCNGNSDGACNSDNIRAFYDFYQTHYDSSGSAPFTASLGVTPLSDYAAGVCAASISGYSDWYLPAICEMGYDQTSSGSGCGSSGSPTVQNIQSNLVDTGIVSNLSATYWSSTESSLLAPAYYAWYQLFLSGGASEQGFSNKNDAGLSGVRCIRALTP